MNFSAQNLLAQLLAAPHRHTREAPKDARGLYGLVDHLGCLRYIGSTKSPVRQRRLISRPDSLSLVTTISSPNLYSYGE